MAEERKTSFARDVHLSSYDQNLLDRQATISARFNEAADPLRRAQQNSNTQSNSQGTEGGLNPVRAATPMPSLQPRNGTARQGNVQSIDERSSAEVAGAKAQTGRAQAYEDHIVKIHQATQTRAQAENSIQLANEGPSREHS